MNIFVFLTFFYMFIILSTFLPFYLSTFTFTTISYIPIERRVPKMHKKPHRRVLSLRWGCRRYCCGYMKTVRRSESDGFLYRKAFTQSLYLGSPF